MAENENPLNIHHARLSTPEIFEIVDTLIAQCKLEKTPVRSIASSIMRAHRRFAEHKNECGLCHQPPDYFDEFMGSLSAHYLLFPTLK